jgi:hypothetical protein
MACTAVSSTLTTAFGVRVASLGRFDHEIGK